ncbi:hypothetical protein YSY22_19230 [Brevibacillus formosus]
MGMYILSIMKVLSLNQHKVSLHQHVSLGNKGVVPNQTISALCLPEYIRKDSVTVKIQLKNID